MKEKVINIAANDDSYTSEIKRKLIRVLTENGYNYYEGFNEDHSGWGRCFFKRCKGK